MYEIIRKKDGRWKVIQDGKVLEVFATEAEAIACKEKWDIPRAEPRRYRRRKVEEVVVNTAVNNATDE